MPPVTTQSIRQEQDYFFKSVLAEFSKTFGSPSTKHPNVRCVSKTALVRELVELRNRLAIPGFKDISGKAILDSLAQSGLIHPVPLIDPNNSQPIEKFFSVGLNEASHELDPIELLQAIVTKGVMCYFTAVYFHDLSTQIPTHHHIARVTDTLLAPRKPPADTLVHHAPARRTTRKRDPLGERQFLYQGVPYYITTRDRRRVPGIQERYFTNKTIFSVTTYEQTLLDTLDRPLSCGGPSVVFEAWDNAASELDQDRLLHYLQTIGDQRISRRVGYMLFEHLEHALDAQLENYLQHIRQQVIIDETATTISLLPGYKYIHTNLEWRLEVP